MNSFFGASFSSHSCVVIHVLASLDTDFFPGMIYIYIYVYIYIERERKRERGNEYCTTYPFFGRNGNKPERRI